MGGSHIGKMMPCKIDMCKSEQIWGEQPHVRSVHWEDGRIEEAAAQLLQRTSHRLCPGALPHHLLQNKSFKAAPQNAELNSDYWKMSDLRLGRDSDQHLVLSGQERPHAELSNVSQGRYDAPQGLQPFNAGLSVNSRRPGDCWLAAPGRGQNAVEEALCEVLCRQLAQVQLTGIRQLRQLVATRRAQLCNT